MFRSVSEKSLNLRDSKIAVSKVKLSKDFKESLTFNLSFLRNEKSTLTLLKVSKI